MPANLEGPALQDYLVREVENLCDADPGLVAEYITALITSGDSPAVIKSNLEEKLEEFFGDQTLPFIDRLFKELGYDSSRSDRSNRDHNDHGSRRRYSDFSDEEDDGDRNFKHRRPRTEMRDDGGRSSRYEDERHYKRRYPDSGHSYSSSKHSRNEDYRSSRGGSIPSGPAAMYDSRGRGGRGYRGDMTGGSNRPRPLCRDYTERGYCMRGDMCPYDHGADRIVVDEGPFNNPFPNVSAPIGAQMGPAGANTQLFGMPSGFEAYDPEAATAMPVTAPGNMAAFPADMSGMMMPQDDMGGGQRAFANMRGMRGRGRGGRGRGGMGGGYQQNRQYTTLVVENIPPEFCEISKVNDYFKKFGSLTNISVQAHLSKAILQYSTNAEANAAYSSPDPIFGNRFVKVYWYKGEPNEEKLAADTTTATTPTAPKPEAGQKRSEPDPEEVAARAAELAKQREEKQKKHQERMKAILELQKQKEQLLKQQIEEQKRLMDKLSNSQNMSQQEKEELLKSLRQIASDIDASKLGAASTSQTQQQAAGGSETSEDLKAKLAKLEAEAASLGLNPHSLSTRGRGGFYGRGRGWPRMRGGYARYTLDNRPTSLLVEEAALDQSENLRKHFEQYGRVVNFENKVEGIVVQYSQRFEAEKAMAAGANTPYGAVKLSWYTQTAPKSETPTQTQQQQQQEQEQEQQEQQQPQAQTQETENQNTEATA